MDESFTPSILDFNVLVRTRFCLRFRCVQCQELMNWRSARQASRKALRLVLSLPKLAEHAFGLHKNIFTGTLDPAIARLLHIFKNLKRPSVLHL